MPFKSKAQARFMFAAQSRGDLKPGTAKRWAHETPDFARLPQRVGKRARSSSRSSSRGRARSR